MTNPSHTIVKVSHQYDAPAERVYDAFLDPQQARKFLFATDSGEMTRAESDSRVGGKFIYVDRRDGEDVEHVGEYLELERPHKIVFRFAVQSDLDQADPVTIEIQQIKSSTLLTLTHELKPEWADFKSKMEEGWTGILSGLAETLSGLR